MVYSLSWIYTCEFFRIEFPSVDFDGEEDITVFLNVGPCWPVGYLSGLGEGDLSFVAANTFEDTQPGFDLHMSFGLDPNGRFYWNTEISGIGPFDPYKRGCICKAQS